MECFCVTSLWKGGGERMLEQQIHYSSYKVVAVVVAVDIAEVVIVFVAVAVVVIVAIAIVVANVILVIVVVAVNNSNILVVVIVVDVVIVAVVVADAIDWSIGRFIQAGHQLDIETYRSFFPPRKKIHNEDFLFPQDFKFKTCEVGAF